MQTAGDNTEGRFAALFRASAPDSKPEHDQVLLDGEDWVVVPTLGAIVPNWLIVVPRAPALNFCAWKKRLGKTPQTVLIDLCDRLELSCSDVVWFEHGPADSNSEIGCGADHAHLHIIFRPCFTFKAFVEQTIALSGTTWTKARFDEAYDVLPSEESYLVAGSGEDSILSTSVESVGSQFFRRVVGVLSDQAGVWDYRLFPHKRNIMETIVNFRALETASAN